MNRITKAVKAKTSKVSTAAGRDTGRGMGALPKQLNQTVDGAGGKNN